MWSENDSCQLNQPSLKYISLNSNADSISILTISPKIADYNESIYEKSRKTSNPDTVKPFKCESCSESFNIKINLILHIHLYHVDLNQEDLCCPICSQVCNRLSSYRSHLLIHTVEDQISCDYCGNIFDTQFQLDEHVQEKHVTTKITENNYKCTICSEILQNIGKYRQHMYRFHKNHVESKSQKRLLENSPVQNSENLIEEGNDISPTEKRRRASKEKFFDKMKIIMSAKPKRRVFEKSISKQDTGSNHSKPICSYCKKYFKYQSELKRHLVVHTKSKEFSCDICEKSFTQRKSLLQHQQKCIVNSSKSGIHKASCIKLFKRPKIVCKYCKVASFNSFITYRWHLTSRKSLCSIYERHQIIHPPNNFQYKFLQENNRFDKTDYKKFVKDRRTCYTINKRNHMKALLKNEKIQSENFEYDRQFACHICSRSYQKKIHLNEHLKNVHSNIKYSCQKCQVTFANKHSLYRHLRVFHNKFNSKNNYYCTICNARFSWKNSLVRHHSMVHVNEKMYLCPICNKQFNRLCNIRRHLIDVHETINEKPIEIPNTYLQTSISQSYANELYTISNCNTLGQQQALLQHPQLHQLTSSQIHSAKVYENESTTYYSNLLLNNNDPQGSSNQMVQFYDEPSSQYYQLDSCPDINGLNQQSNRLLYNGNEGYENSIQYTVLQSKLPSYPEFINNLFKCGYCMINKEEKNFAKSSEIIDHVKEFHSSEEETIKRLESGESTNQLYQCPHCSQVSESLYAIQVHIDIHEKSMGSDIQQTTTSHTCIQCALDLNSISALHRHIDKRHPPSNLVMPFYCGLCNVGFKTINSILGHQEQFHNMKSMPEWDSISKPTCSEVVPLYDIDNCYQNNFDMNIEGLGEVTANQLDSNQNMQDLCNQPLCMYDSQQNQSDSYCPIKNPDIDIAFQYVSMDENSQKTLHIPRNGQAIISPTDPNKGEDASLDLEKKGSQSVDRGDDVNRRACKICEKITTSQVEWEQHRRQCRDDKTKAISIRTKEQTTVVANYQTTATSCNEEIVEYGLAQGDENATFLTAMQPTTEDTTCNFISYNHEMVDGQVTTNPQQLFIVSNDNGLIEPQQEYQLFTTTNMSDNVDNTGGEGGQVFYVVTLPQGEECYQQHNRVIYDYNNYHQEQSKSSQLACELDPEKLTEQTEYPMGYVTTNYVENQEQIESNPVVNPVKDPIESLYEMIDLDTTNNQDEIVQMPGSSRDNNETRIVEQTNYEAQGEEEKKKKLHKCQYCGVIFRYPSLLSRHLMTHTGQRPFSCNYCGAAFNQVSAYNNHVATQHEKLKRIRCNFCNKRFNLPQHLKLHILRKH